MDWTPIDINTMKPLKPVGNQSVCGTDLIQAGGWIWLLLASAIWEEKMGDWKIEEGDGVYLYRTLIFVFFVFFVVVFCYS